MENWDWTIWKMDSDKVLATVLEQEDDGYEKLLEYMADSKRHPLFKAHLKHLLEDGFEYGPSDGDLVEDLQLEDVSGMAHDPEDLQRLQREPASSGRCSYSSSPGLWSSWRRHRHCAEVGGVQGLRPGGR